ncbi:phosphonate C-P lyase system protein PhnH [Nesterenkonia muleiensis]|uniref:phosphonate C-P lyase system protein PhnH n=1 Tax=Nesterenkonia muleiensis TaxID=2282648 RepID=UPI000E7691AC|nr:phosphonate C-P lyase system protein PhnH [Nesterenkonia muleiensis]
MSQSTLAPAPAVCHQKEQQDITPGQRPSAPLSPATPAQAQRIYRAVLQATARPGNIGSLPDTLALGERPSAAAPLWVLADLMSTLAAADDEAGKTVTELAVVTGAPVVSVHLARLILALTEIAPEDLMSLHRGTAREPHLGALLVQQVRGIGRGLTCGHSDQAVGLRMTGPGIDGSAEIHLSGVSAEFFIARQAAIADFPRGIDLLLVNGDGRFIAIPRTTGLEVCS